MKLSSRVVFLAIFLACAGLIGFALYLQHSLGLEPCPMCILQRYAFIVVGVIALVAAIHNPALLGRWIYSGLLVVMAATGGGVAIRHVYLEHYPPKLFDCGADVGFMLESFPLTEALPMIFRGTGDCTPRVKAPSTTRLLPVIKLAAGLAMNATAFAISCGVPILPVGFRARASA